eukprot:TRINITY_DN66045_c0_g1_i1.p1 TRINITY_DN66045_c0_g1~~TRINITY_DN66045_c0_g1_i1.p1  ORF type:complete len:577 (-),score=151.53 TRINITY_DN66045_c0_g1_i1:45-1775(-)
MPKILVVKSPYPNLRGTYVESGSNDGKLAFVRQGDASTWIFYSTRFGRGPCWYFGRSLPSLGSLSSFCCSEDGRGSSPEEATWPSGDIYEVSVDGLPAPLAPSAPAPSSCDVDMRPAAPEAPSAAAAAAVPRALEPAAAGGETRHDLEELTGGRLSGACADARLALQILRSAGEPPVASSTRRRLALDLVAGEASAREALEAVAAASRQQPPPAVPLILTQPAAQVALGAGATTLCCEAICLAAGAALRYQWCKDDVPIRRAERPRLMLCGASAKDQGTYVCQVSCGSATISSKPCRVQLSEAASSFETPLRQASEAEARGDLEAAVRLLAEAANAASDQSEAVRAGALSRRAELLAKLSRWQEAFADATAAVQLAPGLVRAHATRGAAAAQLGLLAEAVSSWEAAELLGGVPEAAAQAEACRTRLRSYFAERQAGHTTYDWRGKGDSGENEKPEKDADCDWEESWRKAGFNGRYAGGSSGGYFGGGSHGFRGRSGGGAGSGARAAPAPSAALRENLAALGLSVGERGELPDEETVRKAYRRLALQAHPDKPGGSKEAFQALQNAYEALLPLLPAQ